MKTPERLEYSQEVGTIIAEFTSMKGIQYFVIEFPYGRFAFVKKEIANKIYEQVPQ